MSHRLAKRVLLLGWDAADWKTIRPLIDAGKMPVLEKLIESGVSGTIASLYPIVSPMLWTSIATGKHADKHDILGFVEPAPNGDGVRPVSSTSRRAKALWNILSERGLRSCAVSWFASHPAEKIHGCVVSDRFARTIGPEAEKHPLDLTAVHPPDLFELVGDLRVEPSAISAAQLRAFFGEKIVEDYNDQRLHILARLLAECSSVHNAATYFAECEDWDLLAVYHDSIDHVCHTFMEYYPPAMSHVSDTEAEIYRYVVEGIYRLHDMMLGRLLQLVGDETTVIILSDHGFHNDHLRPPVTMVDDKKRKGAGADPLAWHRPNGILAAAGRGVKRDELVHGASLLDVTPTVLALLGLPVAEDMDGKPLVQIFDQPVEIARIASYETAHPNDGVHRDITADESDPWSARKALEQLAALGYVELNEDSSGKEQAEQAELQRRSNLAQVYFSTHRYEEARALLSEILREHDLPHMRCRLALCLMELGRPSEAEPLLKDVIERSPEMFLAPLLLAQIKLARGQTDVAAQLLEQVEERKSLLPKFHTLYAQIHLTRREWEKAAQSFRKALEADPDSAEAHDGLGVALRETGQLDEALNEHMRAASLWHHRPQTHVNLGLSLVRAKQWDWAIRAFSIAAEMAPEQPFPHRCLAQLYRHAKHDRDKAREHAFQAWTLRSKLRGQEPAFIRGA